jgi:hypothetical protein
MEAVCVPAGVASGWLAMKVMLIPLHNLSLLIDVARALLDEVTL